MDEIDDVAIVGAGPAGSAAALRVLQLRPDARVVLLDAAAFPRDKTCGDGIAAHVFDLLDALGVVGLADRGPAVPRLRLRTASDPSRTACVRARTGSSGARSSTRPSSTPQWRGARSCAVTVCGPGRCGPTA